MKQSLPRLIMRTSSLATHSPILKPQPNSKDHQFKTSDIRANTSSLWSIFRWLHSFRTNLSPRSTDTAFIISTRLWLLELMGWAQLLELWQEVEDWTAHLKHLIFLHKVLLAAKAPQLQEWAQASGEQVTQSSRAKFHRGLSHQQ